MNGSVVPSRGNSQSIPLELGANVISILVTAPDGITTKTYTVNVTRALSAVSTLSALTLSSGILSPVFASSTTSYTASVANTTTSITVRPTLTTTTATVRVNGTLVTSGSNSKIIPLTFGDNTITVEVTAQDGITTSTYRVAVRRISDVSTLSALTLSSGTLSPDFSPNTTSYTASVANATTSITVTPTVTNSFATVRVNSMLVTSGSASQSIPLKVGSNTITILGTDEGGNNTSYTITLIRISNVSTLSDLSLIGGTLSPVFESSTTSYRASVRGEYSSITVRPTLTTTTATVRVNGTLVTSGSNSKIIPLTFGDNTITVEVTAQDGTTMTTYTLTVTRLSNVSTLSSLTLSSGTLSPDFTSNFTLYTAIVADTGSITVKPTGTDPFALIRVNGVQVTSGSASQSIPLALGSNTITVAVTAQDGSNTITYTVAVTRLRLTDSTLSGLMLSSGTLSPSFASSTTSYSTDVPNAVTSITVTPTVTDSNATVQVNDTLVTSGSNSQSIPLEVGSNTITIVATAEDGTTTSNYTVTVTRAPSAVSTLSALALSSVSVL